MSIRGQKPNLPENIIDALLVLLWVYAATGKLLEFHHFRNEMANQQFPFRIKQLLPFVLPPLELLTAGLLLFQPTKLYGVLVSLVLLTTFTLYVFLVVIHFFDHIPCPCGGVMESLGWTGHLLFNLFFLTLNYISYYLKKGGNGDATK